MIVHRCNINCYSLDKEVSNLGIKDGGKWLPFICKMDLIDAAKLTSDDMDEPTYNCTTIFTNNGDTFIIDTPYSKFFNIFEEYNKLIDPWDDLDDGILPSGPDDLTL